MESLNDNQQESNESKKISAIEHNIQTKKETSYYYAHKSRYEKNENNSDGITISGPGIITGGDPVLLAKTVKQVDIAKPPKSISKYTFIDDDKYAIVNIEISEEFKEIVKEDCIDLKLQDRSLELRINVPNSDSYIFVNKKLFQKIVPDESRFKIVKGKIKIELKKKNEDEEWSKLSA